MMKIRAFVEGLLAGLISAILCYRALISPAILTALAIRRKMPHAWFSGLVTWYATLPVIGVSIAVAAVAFRKIYEHASTPKA